MSKRLWIGIFISLGCLVWAFQGIQWAEVFHALQQANWGWFGIAFFLYICGFLLRSVRWKIILSSVTALSLPETFRALSIGFFSNNIFPFRLGEMIRSYWVSQKADAPLSAVVGTVATERFADMFAFLTVFLVAVLFFPFPHNMQHAALSMAGGLILGIVLLIFFKRNPTWISFSIRKLPIPLRWQEVLIAQIQRFLDGTRSIERPEVLIQIVVLSLIIWTIEATVLYLMCHAFPTPITYGQSFFLLFCIGLSVALPQAPGFVGTIEFFGSAALVQLGVPKQESLAMILAIHGFQFISVGLLGMYAILKEGVSFSSLRQLSTTHPSN